ncbi:hypothetical protein Mal4_15040 [Maioricimonas rarisocia]|uniref:Permuted papain-like amidase enzyme, YaeF/YiiX, C92 family n=1 Tax=Maioricimonas rarisocia TaxID=2528026 RepID=A0A517Z433_9PLAN|nr:YiiX/YebB-like N1pC/P60 family cysteine hydrolase [Maioricimonas rarisocia]QDU37195.1 hypothetical protein Mal4_15040 [Maioricimonas rarisocia]
MHALLLAAVLTGTGADPAPLPPQTAAEIAPTLQTGSLIFSKGDCLAVKVFTASPYTHVAVVVVEEGTPHVYDSMNGTGVRRLPLKEYLATQAPTVIHVYHPRKRLTREQEEQLRAHLQSRIGTPYAIRHHLSGKRADGLHCAEYATDALMSAGLIHAHRPPKVSPASLAEGVTIHHIYDDGRTIELEVESVPPPKGSNWCHQLWIDTKVCTSNCCSKLSSWFLCR